MFDSNSGSVDVSDLSTMTVKKKIILIVSVVIFLSLSFHLLIDYFYILPSLERLEVDAGRKDLKRAVLAVDQELEHLSLFCYDWAEWDDTYRFVKDRNQEFSDSNLVENTFLHNRLALLFFIDRRGQVVWGRCYSGELEEFISIEEFPEQKWPLNHPLLQHRRNNSYIKGSLKTSEGAMLLAARPIVPSNGVGEIRGTLVMGRLLCDKCVEMMREVTQVDIEIWTMDCDILPPSACQVKDNLTHKNPTFFVSEQDWIYGYTFFDDIYNQPALLLRTKAWRTIYKSCVAGVLVDILFTLVAAVVVIFLISYLLHRSVSRPLARFARAIAGISISGEMEPLEVQPCHDEIGHLQREFNQMIQRLHDDAEKRRLVEADLLVSEANLSAVLNAAPDGILTLNDKGYIKSVNPAAARMFGYESDALLDKNILLLSAPPQRSILQEEIVKLRDNPDNSVFSLGIEVSGIRRDGTHLLVHCKVGRVEIEGEVRFICIIRDVSGLREIHEKLMRTKHLASIGEMGASIAHEIRNPLAGISGAVQVLIDMSSAERPDYQVLKEIHLLTDRIEGTVVQMLEYAKDWQPEPKLCTIVALIKETVAGYSRQTDLKDTIIKVDGSEKIKALIDPELIGQVLVNLMANAVDSCTDRQGKLFWQVKKSLRDVYITLQDNGSGIDAEVKKNIFKPFFTTKEGGHGLGLAICQKIIEKHNGTIRLKSRVGVGTKVTIVLPKSKFLKA